MARSAPQETTEAITRPALSRPLAYLAAVAGPALFFLLKLEVPSLGVHRFLLLLLPVAACAALAGLTPGLVATGVSALGVEYLVAYRLGFPLRLGSVAVFVVEGVAISSLFEAVHRTRWRLERAFQNERQQRRLLAESEARLRAQVLAVESSRQELLAEQGERSRAETALQAVEEQLRQAQKMEAVGRLAGGVAHDFNNLLSVILGYTALLRARCADDEMSRQLQEILAAAERAADLTRQLLAFSRKQVLEPKVVDLTEVVAGMHSMLSRVMGEDIELVVKASPSRVRAKCDPGQLEQVLLNLAVNARDAMPSGGKLLIETASVVLDAAQAARHVGVAPGRYVTLTVTDSGVGMDAATRSRIFEPFFTTKETGKGTGLGLSTAFGIVKQSGGWITAESEPGKGSAFRVGLPEIDAVPDQAVRKPKPLSLRGSEAVLLVEDDDRVRTLARRILESNGYSVLEACDGPEALSLLERHAEPIHLLLTDMVMPQMSGLELAVRVAKIRPNMRVLFASGYADNLVVDQGIAFLQKPFRVETLLDKVRDVLDAPDGHFRASAVPSD